MNSPVASSTSAASAATTSDRGVACSRAWFPFVAQSGSTMRMEHVAWVPSLWVDTVNLGPRASVEALCSACLASVRRGPASSQGDTMLNFLSSRLPPLTAGHPLLQCWAAVFWPKPRSPGTCHFHRGGRSRPPAPWPGGPDGDTEAQGQVHLAHAHWARSAPPAAPQSPCRMGKRPRPSRKAEMPVCPGVPAGTVQLPGACPAPPPTAAPPRPSQAPPASTSASPGTSQCCLSLQLLEPGNSFKFLNQFPWGAGSPSQAPASCFN